MNEQLIGQRAKMYSADVTDSLYNAGNADWHEWTKNVSVTYDDLPKTEGKHCLYKLVKDFGLYDGWAEDTRYEIRRNYKTVKQSDLEDSNNEI